MSHKIDDHRVGHESALASEPHMTVDLFQETAAEVSQK
jgi:hypothetical protein